ncbi:hypothetical protein [Nocardioides sp. 1609]|uniref:hypothetical protein n=1 Tax=Nocardioides sp. 1609 TaxID=2508327 RepID=UPI00106F2891|nr:hypothetical protein [Nocardioides sp. 1609]
MTVRRTALAATLLIGTTLLAGCGGDDEPEADAASALPSALDPGTSGDVDLDGEADAGAEMTAAELCGFIAEQAPKVADLQPAEYAAATFGSALFVFYTDHGLLTDIDGAEMDALVAEGCPEEAAALLPSLDAASFAELLSR